MRALALSLAALLVAGCGLLPASGDDLVVFPRPLERALPVVVALPGTPEPLVAESPAEPHDHGPVALRAAELIDSAVAASANAADAWSIVVVDELGREVVGHGADRALMPASTQKVLAAAAAFVALGADGRLATHLEATGPVVDGVLDGDLVVIGEGDPALVTDEYRRWGYPARPATRLATLVEALVAQDIRRVTGDLVGVDARFDGPMIAEGWIDRYFWDFDARHMTGLTVDAGLRVALDYGLGDGIGPSVPLAERDVEPASVQLHQSDDPVAETAAAVARLLAERGVQVDGIPRSGTPHGPSVARLATIQSPPIVDLARFALEHSDNHLADGLFHAAARSWTGVAGWEAGEQAVRRMLDDLGIAHDGTRFADGSGLSRDNRVSARVLVDIDRAMTDSVHGLPWVSSMAIMGQTGTLRQRLVGTLADGRFVGKTGTLRDVLAISGTVHGDDGRRYHLAVIANEAAGNDRWRARVVMDELIELLAADLAGCVGGWSPDVPPDWPVPVGTLDIAC